ncbi:MAG TPA: cytochrome c oxidase subunit II [Candidatus Limnocylindria bacterium]|nr:cytochrome c oxidase subunit II [Candidatus Limnocylindria bacterium]
MSGPGSVLDAAGPRAARIAELTWLLTALGAAVFLIVVALLLVVIVRSMRGSARPIRRLPSDLAIIVAGGIVLPAIVLPFLWAVTLRDMRALAEPPGPPELTIEVVGHQFGYLVRYPGRDPIAADTIRIPVGRTVVVRVSSSDVIHSFWVPRLMEKVDMIPGRTNERWVVADRAGRYLLQCAEFCGLYHARMRAWIEALPPAEFDAWLRPVSAGP